MTFTQFGGQGEAEAQTGLPINMRRVGCLVANGTTAGMNLDGIASRFYEEHCVGCVHRRPTGDMPNLASAVEERKAAAAVAAEAARSAERQRHEAWALRVEHRRGLQAAADPAMADALRDIGVLDAEPGADRDTEAREGALRRLCALAERAPQAFTGDVVGVALRLVEDNDVTDLLTALRHLARGRADVAPRVLEAALGVLRRAPVAEAGRCVADLADLVQAGLIDADVVRRLVYLSHVRRSPLSGRRRAVSGDASGLRAVAGVAPDLVTSVLREILPAPEPPVSLVLPAGTKTGPQYPVGDAQRGAACAAVRALSHTHEDIAAALAGPLIANLGVDSDDYHDEAESLGGPQRALATMVVLGVGDVPARLEAAARGAGDELRRRLFGVVEETARLVDPHDRFREPGDMKPGEERRRQIVGELVTTCLARIDGDWGDHCRFAAARVLEDLAGLEPVWLLADLPALLGTGLSAVTEAERVRNAPASPLVSTDSTPAEVLIMQRLARERTVAGAAREVLKAVEYLARADARGVCTAIVEVIANERDTERGAAVVWKLLPLLGRIGRCHGGEPGVIRLILPVLHTYLVDREAALRAAALDAWAEIGAAHPVPSSIADLLPALCADTHVVVIKAVLNAAIRLQWSDDDRLRLLNYAVRVCIGIDAEHAETLKKAMTAALALSDTEEGTRQPVEHLVVYRAGDLGNFDLRDALKSQWLPATRTSAPMAALRLRQAADPYVNDRFNAHDDEELCALLACGAGLAALPVADLQAAAVDLGPERLIGAAQFAEVAWRAARPGDAATILGAVLDATPQQPAYAHHRAVTRLLIAAAAYDASTGTQGAGAEDEHAYAVLAALADLRSQDGDDGGFTAEVAEHARLRLAIRFLLTGRDLPPSLGTGPAPAPDAPAAVSAADGAPGFGLSPAACLRARADRLAGEAAALNASAQQATDTGAYLRAVVQLCDIAAQLLRLDAAELDADTAMVTALTTACHRRAALLETDLDKRFPPQDPLADSLKGALRKIQAVSNGSDAAAALASCTALPLPIAITTGPRRTRRPTAGLRTPSSASEEQPVAVVMAGVDGQLITGPQVLRPSTVYELSLQVQPGPWPQWADRLEAELLSHFTAEEAETPVYSWQRPRDPQQDTALTGTGTLILRFALPAGRPAPPFLVSLRWRGTRDGEPASQLLDVAGHREIRLRPFDASRDFLTSFPVFDERLLALYESLHGAGYDDGQLQAFCRLFTAICRTGLKMTWNKKYKRGTRVTERAFHDDLYTHLQAEPELGGRLQRGDALALGYLDVRHDGITAELKVERKSAVTRERAPKYMGQPTQYAAADGARLSILCILDMSPKASPVGTPENYLFALTPALHGLDNPEAPSLVAVIVVNANLPAPSWWSRRRTATQPVPGP